MCELLAMSSHYPTRMTRALYQLAARAHEPSVNRDGWGLAFWQDGFFEVHRDTHPADDSELLRTLEQQGPAARLCLGYIRHATHGGIGLHNTGPYVSTLGRHEFMFLHNGHLGQIMDHIHLQGPFKPVGETDSEFAFCWLLERIATEPDKWFLMTVDEQLQQIAAFAEDIREYGPANFLFADGETLFVHADRRLQLDTGNVAPPAIFRLDCLGSLTPDLERDCRLPDSDFEQEMLLFASRPLSDEPWQPMDRGELLAVKQGRVLASKQI